jgi:TPP-dependent pyruvate/acetoin dehydrogenase alpha subunit
MAELTGKVTGTSKANGWFDGHFFLKNTVFYGGHGIVGVDKYQWEQD